MKTTLLFVGKTVNKHLETLVSEYIQRITYYQSITIKIIPELKNSGTLSQTEQKEKEGSLIMQSITPATHLILLDERGNEYTSMAFASYLTKKSVYHDIAFVIGGPFGFSATVYNRANDLLSLSKMTFPHQMVRLFFVEQFYRALTIQKNHPYHHQ